jgi:hypothetical protein
MKTLPKILLIIGIVGLIVGLGLYFLKTEIVDGIEVKEVPIKLDKATYYTSQGFFSTNYYLQIQVEPAATAKPDVDYLILLDNGIIKQEYLVSWSRLELAIHKSKTITNKISQDEYTALSMQPSYTTKMFEVRPKHQGLYLVPGIVALVAFITSYILLKRQKPERVVSPPPDPIAEGFWPESSPPYDNVASTPNQASPNGKRWWVYPGGIATDTPPPNANEAYQFVEHSEPVGPGIQGPNMGIWQNKTYQTLKRLVQEGKVTPGEALKYHQAIEETGDDFFEQQKLDNLLKEFGHGAESNKQEHGLPDSLYKKYGIDKDRFRFKL